MFDWSTGPLVAGQRVVGSLDASFSVLNGVYACLYIYKYIYIYTNIKSVSHR